MDTYDYIVIGAGSAGGALASRLSESGMHSVLLLEAGKSSHWLSPIPMGVASLIDHREANWLFDSEPEPSMQSRSLPVPRGCLLYTSDAADDP